MQDYNSSEYFVRREPVYEDGRVFYNKTFIKKELRWRVVHGYNPMDYVEITEDELEKAKYAWITKSIFNGKRKMINGADIKTIEEDWRYYSGWADGTHPKAPQDFQEIKRSVPYHLIEQRTLLADARVRAVIQNSRQDLLNNIKELDNLLSPEDKLLTGAVKKLDTSRLIKPMK